MKTVKQEWEEFSKIGEPDPRRIFLCGFLAGLARGINPDASPVEMAALHDEVSEGLNINYDPMLPIALKILGQNCKEVT